MPPTRNVPLAGTHSDGSRYGTEAANRVAGVLMVVVDGPWTLLELELRRPAQEVLIGLRDATGQTTSLSQFLGSTRVYLDRSRARDAAEQIWLKLGWRKP